MWCDVMGGDLNLTWVEKCETLIKRKTKTIKEAAKKLNIAVRNLQFHLKAEGEKWSEIKKRILNKGDPKGDHHSQNSIPETQLFNDELISPNAKKPKTKPKGKKLTPVKTQKNASEQCKDTNKDIPDNISESLIEKTIVKGLIDDPLNTTWTRLAIDFVKQKQGFSQGTEEKVDSVRVDLDAIINEARNNLRDSNIILSVESLHDAERGKIEGSKRRVNLDSEAVAIDGTD